MSRLKGDPRMSRLVRRAVGQRERPLRRAAEIPYGRAVLTVSPESSADIVRAAKRRSATHNARRRVVENLLWQHLAAQLERRAEGSGALTPSGAGGDAGRPGWPGAGDEVAQPIAAEPVAPDVPGPKELAAALRRRPDVAELLERIWPRLTPEALLHDFFGAKPLLEAAGKGLLSSADLALLYRPRSTSVEEVPWAQADIALLDEANWLLGPVRNGRQAATRAYGHIVVDEVQDLSPMELRMVGRRSLSGSMTLVGDIAQATGNWAPASWEDLMANLPARRGWRLASLSVSYRAPAEVMDLAANVLAAALPGTVPPEPVRHTGHPPRLVPLISPSGADDVHAWHALLARTVREELRAVSAGEVQEDGTVGVLVPAVLVADVRSALVGDDIAFGEVGAGALDTPVSLLALQDAKGLEFDSVVVVEPARIVAQPPEGWRALYVALTRCTRRLAIVHREPLPGPLRVEGLRARLRKTCALEGQVREVKTGRTTSSAQGALRRWLKTRPASRAPARRRGLTAVRAQGHLRPGLPGARGRRP